MSDTFETINERFRSACSHLSYGEIVALPDFSYLESMSAVELLDSRLDSGMALLAEPIPEVSSELTPLQLQGYLDTTIFHIAQWLEGQSLPHTLYSSIYLHQPALLENNLVVKAVLAFVLFLSETLHKLIHQTNCLREDDYAYASIKFEEIDYNEAESLLLKAEKLIDNEENLIRLKFFRGLCNVITNILKNDGFTSAENFLAFTTKQFAMITDNKSEEVSSFFNKNFCLRKIPHFLPNKIYDGKSYDFKKAQSRLSNFLKTLEFLIKLKEVYDIEDLLDALNNLPSFDILSRAIIESLLFTTNHSQILLFSKTPFTDLIVKNMQKFGADIEFLSLSEDFAYFLGRVEIVFKEYVLLKLKNKEF